MMRVFIAIAPPVIVQQVVHEIRRALPCLPARWVKPDQVHLTLKFFGNALGSDVALIRKAMEHVGQETTPFRIVVRSLGCFPNAKKPRVLWMGLDDPQNALTALSQRLTIALSPLLLTDRQSFRPHLTLARPRAGYPQLLELLKIYQHHVFGEIEVAQLHLFQSHLQSQGAVHRLLYSSELRN